MKLKFVDVFRSELDVFFEMVYIGNINPKLVNSLHDLQNFEIGGLDCCVITAEYRTPVHCIHM